VTTVVIECYGNQSFVVRVRARHVTVAKQRLPLGLVVRDVRDVIVDVMRMSPHTRDEHVQQQQQYLQRQQNERRTTDESTLQ